MKSMSFFVRLLGNMFARATRFLEKGISFTGIFSGRVFSQITTHLPRVFPIICLPFALRL